MIVYEFQFVQSSQYKYNQEKHENNNNYEFCSSIGYNYFNSFNSLEMKPCFDLGSRILFTNKWIRVYAHNYLEDAYEFSWDQTKYFIEFYDEYSILPIGIFTSDLLISDCNIDCLIGVKQFGLNRSIDIHLINELDTTVAYIDYKKPNISMYLRRVNKGFNFGLVVKKNINKIEKLDGLCFNECSSNIKEIYLTKDCIERINQTLAYEICLKSFTSLDIYTPLNKSNILNSCLQDVMIWQDVMLAIDWRWYLIDLKQLLNRKIDLFTVESTKENNSLGLVHHEVIKSYQSKLRQIKSCKEDALFHTQKKLTKINVINTEINDHIELNQICKLRREKNGGEAIFYLPHPYNVESYIQCDHNGRSFIQSCPKGTKFTINLACERINEKIVENFDTD